MKIYNATLLSISPADLDANGTLRIPYGVVNVANGCGNEIVGMREIYMPNTMQAIGNAAFCNNPELSVLHFGSKMTNTVSMAFAGCPNIHTIEIPSTWQHVYSWAPFAGKKLKNIVRVFPDGRRVKHEVSARGGMHFYEQSHRQIAGIRIANIQPLKFDENGVCGETKIKMNVGTHTFFTPNIPSALRSARVTAIMYEWKHQLWVYGAQHGFPEAGKIDYVQILTNAAQYTLNEARDITPSLRAQIKKHQLRIPQYVKYLRKYAEKYPRVRIYCELKDATLDELAAIIMPRARDAKTHRTCTRLVKAGPISATHMNKICDAGYKNPGAFPYEWIRHIPVCMRGAETIRLHNAFRAATVALYGPDRSMYESRMRGDGNTLAELSRRISGIIHQPVQITFLGTGHFSKTYKVKVSNARPYVWKIYHSDGTHEHFASWAHDVELQNSFLAGGKKYAGKIKFREIATAGISTQRGERYLIYPFVRGTPQIVPRDPYACIKRFHNYDFGNAENCRGNTLTDMGAMHTNDELWCGGHVPKIVNTIVYNAWGDLINAIQKYRPHEIRAAAAFIAKKIKADVPNYDVVMQKIAFLESHCR